jgi:hypothetical protein
MRAYTPLLAFVFLLLSSAPAAHADLIFNNGMANTVTSPINDRVQILNNTVVIFNASDNVTASSFGGSLAAVSVFDTSRVSSRGGGVGYTASNTASGLNARGGSMVSVSGGTFTGSISSSGGVFALPTGARLLAWPGRLQAAGAMFWFMRKRFMGSSCALSAASRA